LAKLLVEDRDDHFEKLRQATNLHPTASWPKPTKLWAAEHSSTEQQDSDRFTGACGEIEGNRFIELRGERITWRRCRRHTQAPETKGYTFGKFCAAICAA
jgi:hypothetical protein